MTNAILIAALDFSQVAADEFDDWYDTEHIPERRRVPGFVTAERWIGADNPAISLATYDLANLAVLESPAYQAIGGANLSPWSKRITARCQRLLRFEGEDIRPAERLAAADAGGLLVVAMTPKAEVETAFNAWYDAEHLPALAGVPGVLAARRFRAPNEARPRYVAVYHLAEPGVQEGAAWIAARDATPMPQNVRAGVEDRLRLVCRKYRRRD
jgi:hypothetical protein